MQALLQQAERHVHARHGRAQFMGGTQDELAAHPFEGALFGHVMQHHDRAEDVALGMADRREAVG
ncbi:hypothetical protein D3C78_1312080 [compost metagenome]